MSKTVKTKTVSHNNPYLAHGAVAAAFCAITAILALICGAALVLPINDFLTVYYTLTGSFAIVAGLLALLSLCFGVVAIVMHKQFALPSLILSLCATLFQICAFGTAGFDSYSFEWPLFLGVLLIATICSLISFILFSIYWANAPIKTVYARRTPQKKLQEQLSLTLKRIEILGKLYKDNVLTYDEFTAQKKLLLNSLDSGKKNEDISKYNCVPRPKKKTAIAIILSIILIVLIGGGAVLGVQFACYETVYNEIVSEMGDLYGTMNFFYEGKHYSDKLSYLLNVMLPFDYKDTAMIAHEYYDCGIYDYVNGISSFSTAASGKTTREAYARLLQHDLDTRWNSDKILRLKIDLFYDMEWADFDGHHFSIRHSYSAGTTPSTYISTNLPNSKADYVYDYGCYVIEKADSIVISFFYSNDHYVISNFIYEPETDLYYFDVYCSADGATYTMKG